jgi:carbon-monoxide dehydrogenase large subunit
MTSNWTATSVPLRRHEDLALLTGQGRFVADLHLPGQLTMTVVRSPVAHGRLVQIDATDARELPGVHSVWTATDIAADLGAVPEITPRLVSNHEVVASHLQPVLAQGRVRYVGEPVAVVVADDRYVAEDAADLVVVDIEPLDAITDVLQGHDEIETLHVGFGDADDVFAEAPVVTEAEFAIERHSAVPIETRGLAADYDQRTGRIVVYGSAKVPHWNRAELARQLGIEPDAVVMRETEVGGSFGVRGEFYPEDFLLPWAARRLGRPVVWAEDRWEHLVATNHARGQVHRATLAGDHDGRILAVRTEYWADLGAYVRTNGMRVPELTAAMLPGPYRLEAYSATGHCMGTNRTPTGTYRSPGRVESAFVRERLVELYAARIGADPVEVRQRNLLRAEDLPYRCRMLEVGPQINLESGDPQRLLGAVVARIGIEGVRARQAAGERIGVGVAAFLELSAGGPPWETGAVQVDEDGTIRVRSGASSVGQGVRTALAQIVAADFGVDPEAIVVEHLDTDALSSGVGTFASRSTVMAGNAVHEAAGLVLRRARALVAEEHGSEEAGRPIDLALAAKLALAGDDGPLQAETRFTLERPSSDFGAHAAIVRVDDETGEVDVERLVLGFDLGPAINPMLVEGQLFGGAVQALGGALLERFVYDANGNPLVTSFMDYLLPTVTVAPRMEAIIDESAVSPSNPLGVNGCGEGGMTGVAPAIANAVGDALGRPELVTSVPIDPELLAAVGNR